ncbi:TonB-linked outer membrane protein, SusC/RagA family [Maribacter sedimenticola]|uniref:TonB-linked outer membrane protein, SusC/RagA family n=1 Tax=Maribacter sedimenticola TaxID=228956 RepID=A0ABY1SED3_9FLAO|nr:TonB-dependent receptor [Maribacter sedimenticola]SNR31181.1 TonB-linked outer membrane protein, SusC/RagA family [Maribacter sedimenticola]
MKHIFKNSLLLLTSIFMGITLYAQDKVVTGTVADEYGVPLAGVSVVKKNTTAGTSTDFDGNYSISAQVGETLVFSYLGYKMKEVKIGQSSTIDINMEEDAGLLDEVVVIGYGTSARRDLTGSVASVSGGEVAAVPVPDVGQALQGKLAGVNITTQDGRPGADVKIRVRGGGSVSQSNDPLYIVDGFQVNNISNIPGSQIQSIDVLKDAASTAIYGARGANGVIIVTTKSGKAGQTKVSYDGYTQFSNIPEYIPVMNGYDYIAYNWAYADAIGSQYRDAWERLWSIGDFEGSNTAGIDNYRSVPSRDFTKELYNGAFTQNHSVNITSGNENTRYLLSANHIDQEGNKVRSFYKRTNLQFKLDQKLGEKLNLNLNTRFAQINQGNNEGNSTAYYFRPLDSEYILGDSDVTSNTQLGDYDYVLSDTFNPVSQLYDTDNSNINRELVANTALTWNVVNGLTAKSSLSVTATWNKNKEWTGAIVNNYLDGNDEPIYGGDAEVTTSEAWRVIFTNTLNYEFQGLGDDHRLSILGGTEIIDGGAESVTINGERYPSSFDAERAWANMDSYLVAEQQFYRLQSNIAAASRWESYFGRLNYAFKDKYLLSGTFRADGSSKFAPSQRWGYFPAGAFGWRLSEESFLNQTSWIDDLKLRVSYGTVGNDRIPNSAFTNLYELSGNSTYSINEVLQPAYVPASESLGNPEITWETTITRNIGLDFTVLDSKLSGTIEVYHNSVKDLLLLDTSLSEITGFSSQYRNVGQTSNKGVEVSMNADLVTTDNFNLQGNFNINFNRNNVDELADGINPFYSSEWGGVRLSPNGDYVLEVDRPVGLIRGWQYDGWYTTDDFNYDPATEIYTLKDGVADYASGILPNIYGTFSNKPGDQTAYPGVQKVKDINGDGLIDDLDLGVIGNTNPKHTGGFGLTGNYKAFDFGLNFTWSYGNDIYNATHVEAYLGNKETGLFRNRFQELAGHYKIYDIIDGQLTKVVDPAALDALNANASTFLPYPESAINTSFGVEDGSYLRLNTATLGYSIPENTLSKIGLKRLRLYGSIFNVFTLTGYSGFDPEINANEYDGGNRTYPTPGLDFRSYPRARTYTFGINVEF